ncbi:MAG: sterol desaturase family protein [Vicinamibacteria bacterium]|nr:sterol desaturase family protein [Vicinamibacteria bacterium]
MNYIALAIPVFFLLIGIEWIAARLERREVYRLNDSVADLSCGVLDQVLDVFTKTLLFAGYLWLFEHHRLFDVPASAAWAWVVCFFGIDFLYYWFHRMSHEVNAFWAAHVVHHQSEEYNLTVALRQGALQGSFSWVFYLPLALVGFPPAMFLTLSSFNTLYQFWIHTRLIGRMGPFEWFFNTPSHHRVHHARNPKYIDRNHGGTLIVWDRLFGTFVPEADEPVYGVTTPLRTWNPVRANLAHWAALFSLAARATSWRDRLRVFVGRPGWQPAELGGFQPAPEVEPGYRKFDPALPRGVAAYVFVQFALLLLAAGVYFNRQDALPLAALLAGAGLIVAGVVAAAGLLERRAWAPWLEAARLVAAALAVAGNAAAWTTAVGAFAALSIAGLSLALRASAQVPQEAREAR